TVKDLTSGNVYRRVASNFIATGDTVMAASGQIYKLIPKPFTYVPLPEQDARLTAGIKVWTEDQLLNVLAAGVLKPITDTQAVIEDNNIVGQRITLIVKTDVGASAGSLEILVNESLNLGTENYLD